MSTDAPTIAAPGLRQRALKDVLVQIVARVGNLALGLVVTALVVRNLGDVRYGQWLTILTTFQLVGFFTSLGLEAVALRESAADPERTRTWLGALIFVRVALTIPTMAAAVVALLLIEEDATMLLAGLVLLLLFPLSIAGSLQIVHELRLRNTVPMVVLTVNSVVWAVCVLVIDLRGGGLVALAIAFTATTALTAGIQAVTALRLLGVRLSSSRPAVVELLRVGAPLGVAGLLVNCYARIDQIIVFELSGSAAAGIYGAVYRILEQAHFVPISLLTTLAPVIAALYATDRGRMLRAAGLAARLLAIGSFGALAFVIVAAEPVVRFIFGEEFVRGADALPVLGGAFVFICFGYLVGNLLLVIGFIRLQIVIGLAGLVVNVAGNLLLVPTYGYMGAAWMTLLTEAAVVGTGAWFAVRGLELRRVSLEAMFRIAVSAGLLGGALAVASALGAGLLLLVVVACVAYPAALVGLRAVSAEELRGVLTKNAVPARPAAD